MTVKPEQRTEDRRKIDSAASAKARKEAGLPERRKGGRRGNATTTVADPRKLN